MRKVVLILAMMGAILSGVAPSVCAQASPAATTTGVVYLRSVKGIFATQSTITADAQAISTTATWSNAGVTFTHWKANVTDTASANGSLLLDMQVAGTTVFRVKKTGQVAIANADGYFWLSRGGVLAPSDGVFTLLNNAQSDFTRLQLGGTTSSFPSMKRNGAQIDIRLADDSGYAPLAASTVASTQGSITNGAGTGIAVNAGSVAMTHTYKVTIASTAFVCNATTCDVTIGTLPAKTFLMHSIADLTQTFACSATCTSSTLSMVVGKTAGGNQYLLSFDADAATAQFGDVAAELGASLAPATVPTEIGDLANWSGATAIVLRLTSGTGVIGNGSVSNLSQGSVTIYLTTTRMP